MNIVLYRDGKEALSGDFINLGEAIKNCQSITKSVSGFRLHSPIVIKNANVTSLDLTGMQFVGIEFVSCDFSLSTLTEVKFERCSFIDCKFNYCRGVGEVLGLNSCTFLGDCRFDHANLSTSGTMLSSLLGNFGTGVLIKPSVKSNQVFFPPITRFNSVPVLIGGIYNTFVGVLIRWSEISGNKTKHYVTTVTDFVSRFSNLQNPIDVAVLTYIETWSRLSSLT